LCVFELLTGRDTAIDERVRAIEQRVGIGHCGLGLSNSGLCLLKCIPGRHVIYYGDDVARSRALAFVSQQLYDSTCDLRGYQQGASWRRLEPAAERQCVVDIASFGMNTANLNRR